MHTIKNKVFAIVSMSPVISGFDEWIHHLCKIHLAKREKLYRAG